MRGKAVMFVRLTGEGEFSQRYVTVQAVINETNADSLCLHLHPRQKSRITAGVGASLDSGIFHYVFCILQQPRGSLIQMTYKTRVSGHVRSTFRLLLSNFLTFAIGQGSFAVRLCKTKVLQMAKLDFCRAKKVKSFNIHRKNERFNLWPHKNL